MAMPHSKEARLFYRASFERFKDARLIYERAERTTAAVYLAGYAVECMLKALILSQLAAGGRAEMLKQFRGGKAHDFEWLRGLYRETRGPMFPKNVVESFVVVEDWGTEMRYNPGVIDPEDAVSFLRAAECILEFADGRL